MRIRLSILATVVVAVIVGLMAVPAPGSRAAVGDPAQIFDVNVLICLDGSMPDPTSPFGPGNNCGSENTTAGAPITLNTAIRLPQGSRLTLPFTYTKGFTVNSVGEGSNWGTVWSQIDLQCDGTFDQFAKASPLNDPNDYLQRSINWESSNDINGVNEGYLNKSAPKSEPTSSNPNIPFLRVHRARADATNVNLGGTSPFAITPPVPLNTILLHPKWASADTNASVTLLGGAASSPSTQLNCLQAPQNSKSTGSYTNPANSGLYPIWTTFFSAADLVNNDAELVVVPNCKWIGPAGTDADKDCWDDVGDTNNADPDQDDDGLLDGIEIAWGSNPNAADTDGDGRTDLEEMAGPATALTDPTKVDTDGDLVNDGGFILGAPTSSTDTLGRIIVRAPVVSVPVASAPDPAPNKSTKKTTPFEGDNCPNVNNPLQTNTDNEVIGPDKTNPDDDFFGDACDNDADNDDFVDGAESTNRYDAAGLKCSQDTGFPAAATDPTKKDSSGDSLIDGRKCQLGRDPAGQMTPTQVKTQLSNCAGCGTDADGLTDTWETFVNTMGIRRPGGSEFKDVDSDGADGNVDADSDNDGIKDGIEVFVKGTSAVNLDSDRDGICDTVEIKSLDGDDKVFLGDVTQVALSWNQSIGQSGYSGNKDLDGDGKVFLGDITQVSLHWNLTATACPTELNVP